MQCCVTLSNSALACYCEFQDPSDRRQDINCKQNKRHVSKPNFFKGQGQTRLTNLWRLLCRYYAHITNSLLQCHLDPTQNLPRHYATQLKITKMKHSKKQENQLKKETVWNKGIRGRRAQWDCPSQGRLNLKRIKGRMAPPALFALNGIRNCMHFNAVL